MFALIKREELANQAVLVYELKAPGSYDAKFAGPGLAGGVYFPRQQVSPLDLAIERDSKSGAGTFIKTKRLMVLADRCLLVRGRRAGAWPVERGMLLQKAISLLRSYEAFADREVVWKRLQLRGSR